MAKIRLTKTELRNQQLKLRGLERYLPTLQLKKALLQSEVSAASSAIEKLSQKTNVAHEKVRRFAELFTAKGVSPLFDALKIESVEKSYENVAGIELPMLEKVVFAQIDYPLFDTPYWIDSAIEELRSLISLREELNLAVEKKQRLQKELREVSIRVNLFEKVMIPRAKENIRKIKIFLGDQQLAAVGQAKVALSKIMLRKQKAAV